MRPHYESGATSARGSYLCLLSSPYTRRESVFCDISSDSVRTPEFLVSSLGDSGKQSLRSGIFQRTGAVEGIGASCSVARIRCCASWASAFSSRGLLARIVLVHVRICWPRDPSCGACPSESVVLCSVSCKEPKRARPVAYLVSESIIMHAIFYFFQIAKYKYSRGNHLCGHLSLETLAAIK